MEIQRPYPFRHLVRKEPIGVKPNSMCASMYMNSMSIHPYCGEFGSGNWQMILCKHLFVFGSSALGPI
jgi:hypothetical protein